MYVRICKGLTDKGILVPHTADLSKYTTDSSKDYYTSVYKYNEKQKKDFDKTGSVAGFKDVITDKLVFDFDDENNPENSKEDTQTLVDRLIDRDVAPDAINVFFSGKKGFHVTVETKESFNPKELKQIAKSLAGDLDTFDTKIYNSNRIFRIPNTLHQKSQLYKIQIGLDELESLSLDEIKKEAFSYYGSIKPIKVKLPEQILSLKKKEEKEVDSLELPTFNIEKKPKELSPWKYALELGFFPPGSRNHALMILAATYKGLGYAKTKCYYALKSAADYQAQRFNQDKYDKDQIYKEILNTVYSESWQNKTYSEDSFDDKLIEYLTKDKKIPRKSEEKYEVFKDFDGVFGLFRTFAENIDKNTIKTGISDLDSKLQLTTGMLVGLLGAPSSNKTGTALNIMRTVSDEGEQVAFFSMDMSGPLVMQRAAQKVLGYSSEKLIDIFRKKNKEKIAYIQKEVKKSFKNVDFCLKTAMRVEDIKKSLEYKIKKSNGEYKPRLVVIDYLECIGSEVSDSTAKISMIAQDLKDLAIDLDVCILLLLQPPKRVGDPSHPILSYSDIKGAATVAQACSVVVSLWREGFNPKDTSQDKYISLAVLKNRMGQLTQVDCAFDGLRGSITPLDDTGKFYLKSLRESKKAEKDEEDF